MAQCRSTNTRLISTLPRMDDDMISPNLAASIPSWWACISVRHGQKLLFWKRCSGKFREFQTVYCICDFLELGHFSALSVSSTDPDVTKNPMNILTTSCSWATFGLKKKCNWGKYWKFQMKIFDFLELGNSWSLALTLMSPKIRLYWPSGIFDNVIISNIFLLYYVLQLQATFSLRDFKHCKCDCLEFRHFPSLELNLMSAKTWP